METIGEAAGAELRRAGEPPIDFIFIDGDHSYEGLRRDWESWRDMVAPGGVVALHDSRSTPNRPIDDAGSARYTSDVVLADPRFHLAETVDSLTVLHRPTDRHHRTRD